MKFPTAKTQIIAAAAVLLLLGGFTAALAYDGNGTTPFGDSNTSTQSSTSSTSSTSTSASPTATTTTVSVTATTSCVSGYQPDNDGDYLCRATPEIFNLLLSPPQLPPPTASPHDTSTIAPLASGHAYLSVQGNAIYADVQVTHLTPLAEYTVSLDINGAPTQLATLVTNQDGNGYIVAQLLLADGTYTVSVQVIGASSIGTTTLALVSKTVTIVTPAPGPISATADASVSLGDDK